MGRRKQQLGRLREENAALRARINLLLGFRPSNDARVRQATDTANQWWREALAAQARVRELEAEVEHYMGETEELMDTKHRLECRLEELEDAVSRPMPTVPPIRVTVHEYGNSILQTEKAADPWRDWT